MSSKNYRKKKYKQNYLKLVVVVSGLIYRRVKVGSESISFLTVDESGVFAGREVSKPRTKVLP